MELRNGYKQTEVGVVPNEWKIVSLIHLAEGKKELFDDGDWIEAEHITDEGIRLIQTGNIGEGKFIEKNDKKYIYPESFELLKCKELIEGDLLICRLAEPAGRACVFPNIGEDKVITSVDVTIFRPKHEFVNREFLNQLFTTRNWFNAVSENCGGTTHKRISRGALGKLFVPLPDLTEQTAIATALSDMDNLIAELEQLIVKKKAIKQGAMQELLRPKEGWVMKRLGDVGDVKMCRRVFSHETKPEGSIPFYKIGTFGKEADAFISEEHYNSYRQNFSFPKKGEILISAAGTIGRIIIYDGRPAYFQDSNIVWIDNDEVLISNKFLFYILKIVKYNTEGGTIQRLYNAILRSAEFFCPLKDEQDRITEILSDMDDEIMLLEANFEKYKLLKQGMMQELLTGKTRLV